MTNEKTAEEDAGAVGVERDGPVLRLIIDRRNRRNALSHVMIDTLVATLTDAATDDELRVVHISGAGENFCSGVDWVATNSAGKRPPTGDLVRRIPHTAHRVIELVHSIHLPVVCTVRGWAAGMGCNLAIAADFTLADTDAVFWEPFLPRGFSPDTGSTWLLPRLVGVTRAKRMLLLGEKIDAAEAADWGLIHRATPPDELDRATEELLTRLAAGPTVALGMAKQSIHRNLRTGLTEAMDNELYGLELACRTADFKEGLAAFRQRRSPEFHGR
ncbi:enoyl-CoA hydratase/isomerase family protein [Nocardia gamkensis]|uniref:Enoyl-CoA hydratase/isomerase family protein n=1 Tax=Nocardia gamkensis TaxID=352869 RepID=A0A7X6L160_9NOCA|nr:enoyl-CoA hydratase-related protein [Nocardia gamkensis]NKY25802.1 enoyl-CoA hydratase/isomerase family protein [Nocardia gamkensis]NQE69012.1 Short-chain-enoyl-CoA hydratase [Nocardia gamkensis]